MIRLIIAALALAIGGAWLRDRRAVRAVATALAIGVFGWLSLAVGGGGDWRAPTIPNDGSLFLRLDGALLLLAALISAAVGAWSLARRELAGAIVFGGAMLGAVQCLPLWQAAGWGLLPPLLAVALVVAAAALAAGRIPGRAADAPIPRLPTRSGATAAVVVGGVVAILVPELHAMLGGAIVCAVAAELAVRSRAVRRIPWLALAVGALVPVWWFIATVAGPSGLSLAALADGPLSPAAQTLLIPPLAVGALAIAGVWPLHRLSPVGTLLAPVGGALLVRLADGVLPDGVLHWRPALAALAALGIWWSAVRGRRAELLGSAALLGVASGGTAAPLAAGGLFIASALVPSIEVRGIERRANAALAPLHRLAWVAAAACGAVVLGGALGTEVTLATLAACGAVFGMWRVR